MNQKETDLLAQHDALAAGVTKFTGDLDEQIAYLIAVRDGMRSTMAMMEPLVARLRSGKSEFVDNPAKLKQDFEKVIKTTAEARPRMEEAAKRAAKQPPVWKVIQSLMSTKASFTATEAGMAVEKEIGRSLGPNRPQIIRNSLMRHDTSTDGVFRRNDDGSWTVILVEGELPEELQEDMD